jgi:hypothetical protein
MNVSKRMTSNQIRSSRFCSLVPGVTVIGVTLFTFFAPVPADTMFKCRDSAGRMTYTDQPCEISNMTPQSAPSLSVPSPNTRIENPPARNAPTPVYQTPRAVEVPPLPEVDVSGLPKDEQGRPTLIKTPGASLVLEKKEPSPVQAVARCSVLLTKCVEPGKRDLDACFMSAPRCATDTPWLEKTPCCPAACAQRYENERRAGNPPLAAYDNVLFGAASCFPGLTRAGKPLD